MSFLDHVQRVNRHDLSGFRRFLIGDARNVAREIIKNNFAIFEQIIEQLKEHLEKQFDENMTWDNYGEWHIDHIIPLSSANTEEEMYKLCHYTNLQPLWAIDNIIKANTI